MNRDMARQHYSIIHSCVTSPVARASASNKRAVCVTVSDSTPSQHRHCNGTILSSGFISIKNVRHKSSVHVRGSHTVASASASSHHRLFLRRSPVTWKGAKPPASVRLLREHCDAATLVLHSCSLCKVYRLRVKSAGSRAVPKATGLLFSQSESGTTRG